MGAFNYITCVLILNRAGTTSANAADWASRVRWWRRKLLANDLRELGFLFFSFSSRRRHTSSQGDWSSDVCSSDPPARLEAYRQLKTFESAEKMIHSGAIDAILIATPHYQHTTLGIAALQRGVHVLVEKPISVHKADCERLIAANKDNKLVFAAVFQMRTEPRFKKLKSLLTNRELGEVTRVNWIITDWFRTETYYASGGWRATWKGEGGGVLLNQCPHNLDIVTWLVGAPSKVRGFCQLGRFHNIEVEDNVTAYLEWPNGATGVFITSTGEAPGSNRLEIVGERGKLVVENQKISFTRNETSKIGRAHV